MRILFCFYYYISHVLKSHVFVSRVKPTTYVYNGDYALPCENTKVFCSRSIYQSIFVFNCPTHFLMQTIVINSGLVMFTSVLEVICATELYAAHRRSRSRYDEPGSTFQSQLRDYDT